MVNHDWIKPGVKAEIVNIKRDTKLNGRIVTIKCVPELTFYNSPSGKEHTGDGVKLEEGEELAAMLGFRGDVRPSPNNLIPYYKPPNWEKMAKKNAIKQPEMA